MGVKSPDKIVLFHRYAENLDIFQGAVVAVGGYLLYGIDYLKPLNDFAKDRVGPVEVGCARMAEVVFACLR